MTDRVGLWGDIGHRATVPALMAAAVAQFGPRDFVVTRDERMTFADAEHRSRAMAKRLVAAGVSKGTRVGIMLPNSPDFVVAFFAAARIGALVTLLSTTYRPAEIRRVLKLADIDLLIAPGHLFGRDYASDLEASIDGLAEASEPPLHLASMPYLRRIWLAEPSDRRWAALSAGDSTPESDISDELLAAIQDEVYPADPLAVVWTSGSSADPKGVVHTHGVAVRKVSPSVGLGLGPSQVNNPRTMMAVPFFWVAGPQNLLGCLYTGNTLVIQLRSDPAELLELVEREQCTSFSGWPAQLEQVRSHPDYAKRDLSSLRVNAQTQRMARTSSKGDPINLGMTETFGPHFERRLFDYKVIDRESGNVLSEGEEGEFCVRGLGLMHSFYKKEREETFDADGYYHTGDRGYIEDGKIWFTGRYSEMIKSGGANIAPLEVEQMMMSLPGVRFAFVFGLPHPTKGSEVAAVVVPEPARDLSATEIEAATRRLISGYKVPKRIKVADIDDVPWLPSGKPDKRTMMNLMQQTLDR